MSGPISALHGCHDKTQRTLTFDLSDSPDAWDFIESWACPYCHGPIKAVSFTDGAGYINNSGVTRAAMAKEVP